MMNDGNTNAEIVAHWRAGRDTYEISRLVHLPEAVIYNRLPKLRDAASVRQFHNLTDADRPPLNMRR